jgi:thiol-disulfide isomerase/thioredoxin
MGVMVYNTEAQTIKNFKLDDTENTPKNFQELKGQTYTVIDFWATWCKPCLKAIPALIKIQDEYKALGVNFIGISCDGPRSVAKVSPLTKTLQINYPVLLDFNNDIMRDYNISNLPTLLIVDANNKVVYFHEGFVAGDELEIRKQLNQLLGK